VVSGPGGSNRLYHNLGNGKFQDVTKAMGLEHTGWGQGVCAGDFDNDGYTDLFVTYWGANVLYRNRGGHGFEDVTAKAGLKQDRVRYNTGCAFLDYDNDGHLDLFVANYLKFDFASTPMPGENSYCWYRDLPVACGPRGLPFDRNILYHNNGDGTFKDVSDASGIAKPSHNYALSVVTGDFNHDGFTDIYVAADRTPSILYMNHGDGTFTDEALPRGVAFDERPERVAKHVLRFFGHRLEVGAHEVGAGAAAADRPLCDVQRLVPHALQIDDELQRGGEEAQVVRHRLTERKDAQREGVDVDLIAVDLLVDGARVGQPGRPLPEGVEREAHAPLAPRSHGRRVRAELAKLRLVVAARVQQCHCPA